jgi:hypothetical protein
MTAEERDLMICQINSSREKGGRIEREREVGR